MERGYPSFFSSFCSIWFAALFCLTELLLYPLFLACNIRSLSKKNIWYFFNFGTFSFQTGVLALSEPPWSVSIFFFFFVIFLKYISSNKYRKQYLSFFFFLAFIFFIFYHFYFYAMMMLENIFLFTWVDRHLDIYIYIYTCTLSHVHTCMHINVHSYIHVWKYVCIAISM